jgi:hypothetical protein
MEIVGTVIAIGQAVAAVPKVIAVLESLRHYKGEVAQVINEVWQSLISYSMRLPLNPSA